MDRNEVVMFAVVIKDTGQMILNKKSRNYYIYESAKDAWKALIVSGMEDDYDVIEVLINKK